MERGPPSGERRLWTLATLLMRSSSASVSGRSSTTTCRLTGGASGRSPIATRPIGSSTSGGRPWPPTGSSASRGRRSTAAAAAPSSSRSCSPRSSPGPACRHGPHRHLGIKMLGNTLLRWGTEEQKRRFLPRILSGEDVWCQGYSEPEPAPTSPRCGCQAGARRRRVGDQRPEDLDLAAARRATGSSCWPAPTPTRRSTAASRFLLVPDSTSPGVEVRPIRRSRATASSTRCSSPAPASRPSTSSARSNGGWAVATSLLGLERGEEAATNPILFRAELDRIVALAREHGVARRPGRPRRLAWCYIEGRDDALPRLPDPHRLCSTAACSGPEASISKLYWSEYHQRVDRRSRSTARRRRPGARRPAAVQALSGPTTRRARTPPARGRRRSCNARGRDRSTRERREVQRNILAETCSALPREPR